MTHDLCGCCDIREKLKAMWERLQTTIYGIRVNGVRQIPDGQGIIDIEIGDVTVPVATDRSIGGVKSSADNGKVSVSDTGIMTANGLADAIEDSSEALDGIEQLESEIGALQTSVEGHTTQIGDLETAVDVAESDIDELDQDVVRIDGQIDAINTAVSGMQVSKQDKLTSGANIKTINGESVMGAGNIITLDVQVDLAQYNWNQSTANVISNPVTSVIGNIMPSHAVELETADMLAIQLNYSKTVANTDTSPQPMAGFIDLKRMKDSMVEDRIGFVNMTILKYNTSGATFNYTDALYWSYIPLMKHQNKMYLLSDTSAGIIHGGTAAASVSYDYNKLNGSTGTGKCYRLFFGRRKSA